MKPYYAILWYPWALAYLLRGLLSMSYTHLAIIHRRRSSTVMLMVWMIRRSLGQAACGVESFAPFILFFPLLRSLLIERNYLPLYWHFIRLLIRVIIALYYQFVIVCLGWFLDEGLYTCKRLEFWIEILGVTSWYQSLIDPRLCQMVIHRSPLKKYWKSRTVLLPFSFK